MVQWEEELETGHKRSLLVSPASPAEEALICHQLWLRQANISVNSFYCLEFHTSWGCSRSHPLTPSLPWFLMPHTNWPFCFWLYNDNPLSRRSGPIVPHALPWIRVALPIGSSPRQSLLNKFHPQQIPLPCPTDQIQALYSNPAYTLTHPGEEPAATQPFPALTSASTHQSLLLRTQYALQLSP